MPGRPQRVQGLHRLGQHRGRQHRCRDVGGIYQRNRQGGDDLRCGEFLGMHQTVEVDVGMGDEQFDAEG